MVWEQSQDNPYGVGTPQAFLWEGLNAARGAKAFAMAHRESLASRTERCEQEIRDAEAKVISFEGALAKLTVVTGSDAEAA